MARRGADTAAEIEHRVDGLEPCSGRHFGASENASRIELVERSLLLQWEWVAQFEIVPVRTRCEATTQRLKSPESLRLRS